MVEYTMTDGSTVTVAVAESRTTGSRPVSRNGQGVTRATETFEGALESVRSAASAALAVFRDGSLRPDSVEIEFGVQLTAEAGAVIAKSSVGGHLTVKLAWAPGNSAPTAAEDPGASTGAPAGAAGGTGTPAGAAAPVSTGTAAATGTSGTAGQ
ncbi:CU044_2847 family protein [Streptomyces sp. NPDC050504]|uniref:CU044_2847 family protein n=1 Tax=Streptomyces sp. NPDC050504 TaxID=3365618 RepID=UPI0037B750EF